MESLCQELVTHLSKVRRFRHLRIEATAKNGSIVLSGKAKSYYEKQLVQEHAMSFLKSRTVTIVNNVEVVKS